MRTGCRTHAVSIITAILSGVLAALTVSGAQRVPEPGPASGGVRLRLVVTTERPGGGDRHEVRIELLNVTQAPITLLADWPYDQDKGDVPEYLEQAVNLVAFPEIGPWEGQIMGPNRTSPQPEYVLMPDTPLVVQWKTAGGNLKNKENRALDMRTQVLPTDGLYTVFAFVTVRTKDGLLALKSNEQKVPVGGRSTTPKHPLGRTIRVDVDKLRAVIDLGSLQRIATGDQFVLRTAMLSFWRLTIDRVDQEESEGGLTPCDWNGQDVLVAKPPIPGAGVMARLMTSEEPHNQPSDGTR